MNTLIRLSTRRTATGRPDARRRSAIAPVTEQDEQGFGYSREPGTSPASVAVPDGVEGFALTGRIRRAA